MTNPTRAALMQRWGRAIQAAREARGLTRREGAAALGVSYAALHGWEMGRRAAPLANRRGIVAAWGVDPDQLDTGDDWCPHCGRPYEVVGNCTLPKPKRASRTVRR